MGNHSVGQAFNVTFKVLEKRIDSMSKDELLEALDIVGEEFRGSDAEFDDYDHPDKPLGKALIKIFNPDIGNEPTDEAENEKWWDVHYKTVYRKFRERYNFC